MAIAPLRCATYTRRLGRLNGLHLSKNMSAVQEQPVPESGAVAGQAADSAPRHSYSYHCRKCREALVVTDDIVPHARGEGQASFAVRKRSQGFGGDAQEPACTSIFVEQQPWMAGINDGAVEGKVTCPKCGARLGSYSWSGSQCSCGVWVTPAIQLHLNKIDRAVRPSV